MTANPQDAAASWLSQFSSALASNQVKSVTACFCTDGWFRDLFVFTWDYRTLEGTEKISEYLAGTLPSRHIYGLELDTRPGLLAQYGSISPWADGVSAGFTFSMPRFKGTGHFRIQLIDGEWKAFTVAMMLDELKEHGEIGSEEGVYGGHKSVWLDVLRERRIKIEEDPQVVIIGAGHTGLNIAARFKQLDISTLIVEANPRIGDNWRKRYPSLSLHTIRKQSEMLYQPYPSTWPLYTPRDKLADWLEQYAISQDLVVWTDARPLPIPEYDHETKKWTLFVNRKGISHRLHPSHIVIATGVFGDALVPDIKDNVTFTGRILHSSSYNGGHEFSGKRVAVIGAGNTSADICQDLCAHDAASVTMVQRSSTAVVKSSSIRATLERVFPAELPIEICDTLFFSTPLRLLKRMLASSAEENWAHEQDIHEGLKRAGMKLNMGSDGSGVFPMVFERGGGNVIVSDNPFYLLRLISTGLDVGAAALIGEGKIKIKQGNEIERFTEKSIIFTDGSEREVDAVIFATGYRKIRDTNVALFGEEIISKTRPVWGLDEEGEIQGCYRPSGHPGLWFAAGGFENSRFQSKHLALQIQAIQLGLMDTSK